jgi:hypothetical protein
MSRKIKPRRTDKPRRRPEVPQAQRDMDLIRDTAGTFTCSTEITRDFLYQCVDGIEGIEVDLAFNRVAHEIWCDRPGHGQQIAETLAVFIEEREKYLRALAALKPRLEELVQQVPPHEHLEPIDKYRELVRVRMFADVPPPV